MAKIEEIYPETKLWNECEALYEVNAKAVGADGDYDETPALVAADKRFEDLYDLARDLYTEADDLRQKVIELEAEDNSADMEDAIRDVLHEYPRLVVLKHPLLRKLHDSVVGSDGLL